MTTTAAGPSINAVLLNNQGANGAGAAMAVAGLAGVWIQLTGNLSGTITLRGSVDGTNFATLPVINLNGTVPALASPQGQLGAVGFYYVPLGGVDQIQATISAYVSGNATLTAEGIPGDSTPFGIQVTSAGVGLVQLSDGTNTGKVSTKNAQFVAHQNSDKATYTVSFNVSPTASTDLFAIESGASKIVRIRRIVITNPGAQTAAGLRSLQLMRTTAAGVGSAVTPAPDDTTDAAYSGLARSGNTGANLGTAGTVLRTIPIFVPAALAAATPFIIDFGADGTQATKCPTGIAGAANGISLRDPGAAGGVTICGYVEFTEE